MDAAIPRDVDEADETPFVVSADVGEAAPQNLSVTRAIFVSPSRPEKRFDLRVRKRRFDRVGDHDLIVKAQVSEVALRSSPQQSS